MKNKLPDFLIVGAAKSGTSSMHYYLNQHPKIFMPTYTSSGLKVKEPRFLIADKLKNRVSKGIWDFKSYNELFQDAEDGQITGESTVLYLFYYKEAIPNIKRYLGENTKIIIMLRNPIERAYSAYLFSSRTNQENNKFDEALKMNFDLYKSNKSLSPMILYKELGLYYDMVKAYFDHFKDVHIVIYDDFKKDPKKEISRVLSFLNIKNNVEIDSDKIVNKGGKQWNSYLIKQIFMSNSLIKKFLRLTLSKKSRRILYNLLTSFFVQKAPPVSYKIKKQLLQYYIKDIEKLERIINKDLSKWKEI